MESRFEFTEVYIIKIRIINSVKMIFTIPRSLDRTACPSRTLPSCRLLGGGHQLKIPIFRFKPYEEIFLPAFSERVFHRAPAHQSFYQIKNKNLIGHLFCLLNDVRPLPRSFAFVNINRFMVHFLPVLNLEITKPNEDQETPIE